MRRCRWQVRMGKHDRSIYLCVCCSIRMQCDFSPDDEPVSPLPATKNAILSPLVCSATIITFKIPLCVCVCVIFHQLLCSCTNITLFFFFCYYGFTVCFTIQCGKSSLFTVFKMNLDVIFFHIHLNVSFSFSKTDFLTMIMVALKSWVNLETSTYLKC